MKETDFQPTSFSNQPSPAALPSFSRQWRCRSTTSVGRFNLLVEMPRQCDESCAFKDVANSVTTRRTLLQQGSTNGENELEERGGRG